MNDDYLMERMWNVVILDVDVVVVVVEGIEPQCFALDSQSSEGVIDWTGDFQDN